MSVRIVYVGHSTVLVDMDGTRVLTDPLLRARAMHLRRVGAATEEARQDLDAVLVSHLHFDHLDLPSLKRLGRELPMVVPRGGGALLRRKGFGTVSELGVGEEVQLGSLLVRGAPADHDASRRPFGARANPLGYVIEGSSVVYFAGDTGVFDEMSALGPVDVALVPIWGWGPSLGPGHMNPEAAAEAVRLLRARIAIPIHWGTFFPIQLGLRRPPAFIEVPPAEFVEHVRVRAPDTEVRVLRPGEATTA
jgi:L-ascorbate metabolism protein UlaG (beta-lactamase superfamily)